MFTLWPRNSTPSYLLEISENVRPLQVLHKYFHSSFMKNSLKVETTQMSISWMNKQMLVFSFGGIRLLTKNNNLLIQQHGWISESIMLRKEARHTRICEINEKQINLWREEVCQWSPGAQGEPEEGWLEKGAWELFRVAMVVLITQECTVLQNALNSTLYYFYCLAALHGLQDLSSSTRDQTVPLAVKAQSPNHWTARKFPELYSLNECLLSDINYTTTELIFFQVCL